MKEKTLILRQKKDDYFLKYLDYDYIDNIYNKYNRKTIFFKIIKKFKLSAIKIYLGSWKRNIGEYNKIIIFDNGYVKAVSKYIKKKNKNCEIILYLWNDIRNLSKQILDNPYVDKIFTYNQKDATRYGLTYNSQFYIDISTLPVNECKESNNTVVFVGKDKNRKNTILELKHNLENDGIETDFNIIENESDYISYDEYLNKVMHSKCILDIVSDKENSGFSLRVLEALFLKKKLITNNINVKNADFYNENNIYILDEIKCNKIKEFLEKPYANIEQKIVDNYRFENWIRRF